MTPVNRLSVSKCTLCCLAAFIWAACPAGARAQAPAHYVPGIEGLEGPSLPPPGLYLRDYNLFYVANQLNGPENTQIHGPGFQTYDYAQVPRLVWITDYKLLGGNFGLDGLIPVIEQDVRVDTPAGLYDNCIVGLGDPFVEATLSWHPTQFDIGLGAGCWMPGGQSGLQPTALVGLGFWEGMFTAGATWYPDPEKHWAISALNRYEFNGEDRDTRIIPGEVYTVDFGASYSFTKTVEAGVVGYWQQKVTVDTGRGSVKADDMVAGAGPEIKLEFPACKMNLSLAYYYEFYAVNRAEGDTVNLTLTWKL